MGMVRLTGCCHRFRRRRGFRADLIEIGTPALDRTVFFAFRKGIAFGTDIEQKCRYGTEIVRQKAAVLRIQR